MLDPSDTQATCPHFGVCGGCAWQDASYAEQLARKSYEVASFFGEAWRQDVNVTPSPVVWHYRNKMDFSFGRKFYDEPPPRDFIRETVLGFSRKGRWFHLLDLSTCHIAPRGMGELLDSVRQWAVTQGLRGFDTRTREGLLRILLVREGIRTGQKMVVLITGDGNIDEHAFLDAVGTTYTADSLHRAIATGGANVAFAETTEILSGSPVIEEEMHIRSGDSEKRLRFRISPFSFFQTNTLAAELLYSRIREWVSELGQTTLYDLYGGSGGIALSCADLVQNVVSVENVPSATADGIINASMNGIGNVRFHTAAVQDYLRNLDDETRASGPESLAVVDPPRAGMHPKALRRLMEWHPRDVIYVSCKPQVFTRDELPMFLEHYTLEQVEAFDLFPHTPHVEVLARFRMKAV